MEVQELANAVVSRLCDKKMTLSTAESCTGGMLSQYITSISGSSNAFEYGIISYANRIKHVELGVSQDSLAEFGAVSKQVAVEMAAGVREKAKADVGVSTTGIAGPTGGSREKPVGTVHIAVATGDGVIHEKLSLFEECGNDRELIRQTTVKRALMLILKVLDGL